ncbi:hypothetical protein AB0K18_33690 [Nonomuraea sp. NPDC049421]|uniref:hypothetical protein n=1 Tax=Nonomuraea sp. NPDC049421 TaxID=3155275 RepID=UPI0034385440
MYLLTVRAAVVVMAAAFVAALAFALILSTGTIWQMALLSSGAAFGFAIPFFNAIIPPAVEPSSPQEGAPSSRRAQE